MDTQRQTDRLVTGATGKAQMTTNPQVDSFGKVTISLGGRCPLNCQHCYTTVPTFSLDKKRDVDEALRQLSRFANVHIICMSGDTDPFLRATAALEFLQRAAATYPDADLMYTTRLIPKDEIV